MWFAKKGKKHTPLTHTPRQFSKPYYETKVPCISLLVKSDLAVFQLLGSHLSSLSSLTENRWAFLNREWPHRSEPNIKKILGWFQVTKSKYSRKKCEIPKIMEVGFKWLVHLVPFFRFWWVPPIFEVKQLWNQQISSQIFRNVSFLHFQLVPRIAPHMTMWLFNS